MHKTSVNAVPGFSRTGIVDTNGKNWIDFACQLPHLGNRSGQGFPNFMLQFKYSTMYCLPFSTYRRKNFFQVFYQWLADQRRLALLPDTPLKNINNTFIK